MMAKSQKKQPEDNLNNQVKIFFAGDFCPINRIENLALENHSSSLFQEFDHIFKNNDLKIVDLECPLTDSTERRKKTGPHQKADKKTVDLLKSAGIDLVTLANNHIMDYGKKGVEDTLTICKENNIATVGIGKNKQMASIPFEKTIKDKKIAILNFADNEFLSLPDNSYLCNYLDPVNSFYDIQNAKENHDFVFVVFHGGNEFYELPSPRMKKLFRFFVDLGADAVISHHTHVFSGYEIYNDKPIFYSLGNFLYDWPGKKNTGWNEGYSVQLNLTSKVEFEIIPFKQCNEEPGIFLLTDKEKVHFKNTLTRLNKIIADDDQLENEFQKYCQSVYPMYDSFIEPYFGQVITAIRKRGLFPKLLNPKKRLFLLNLSRCESHRDVLIRMLKKYE